MSRIRLFRPALLALLLALPAAGCDTTTEPTYIAPELVGTWSAAPGEPFAVTTLSGLYEVRTRWSWTFRADGTYERRNGLVTATEESDTYVESGTWATRGNEIRFVAYARASASASSNPWPVHLTATQVKRSVHWMSYHLSQGILHLFAECNDTASCAGIPQLTREQ
jgi:hypothetical protein